VPGAAVELCVPVVPIVPAVPLVVLEVVPVCGIVVCGTGAGVTVPLPVVV
jgi:hypothetical protein